VFVRAQTPVCARQGDIVENDLGAAIEAVRNGWDTGCLALGQLPWSLVLVDMYFVTGAVTPKSEKNNGLGMAEGSKNDGDPNHNFGLEILRAIANEISDCRDLAVVAFSSTPVKGLEARTEALLSRRFLPRSDAQSPAQLKNLCDHFQLVPDDTGTLFGKSKAFLLALRRARWAAQETMTVEHPEDILLLGATGTGKSKLAHIIHTWSPRKDRPFVRVNIAALNKETIVSELFGHKKGAFTGATEDHDGCFIRAKDGTLFIDEVGDMSPEVQVKLLLALENRTVLPVGAKNEEPFKARIISATNLPLKTLCKQNKFRHDLYHRLNAHTITLPSLCERTSDIPGMVDDIIAKTGKSHTVHKDALRRLCNHPWNGNYRELRSCIKQVLNEYPDVSTIHPLHLRLEEEDAPSPELPSLSFRQHLELLATQDVFSEDDVNGSLVPIGSLLANLIGAAFSSAKDKGDGRDKTGRTKTAKLLTGRKTLSGYEPENLLRRFLKTLDDMNPPAKQSLLTSHPALKPLTTPKTPPVE